VRVTWQAQARNKKCSAIVGILFEYRRSVLLYCSVSIPIGWTASGWRFDAGQGQKDLSSHSPDRLWGPPSLLSNGCLGVKRSGRKADHSSLSSAEVKSGEDIFPLLHASS
jgi:hypothetical protein